MAMKKVLHRKKNSQDMSRKSGDEDFQDWVDGTVQKLEEYVKQSATED